MNTEPDLARDARTEGQSQWAAYELWEWLRHNPTDTDVRQGFEQFPSMRAILEEVAAERARESCQPMEAGQAM